MAQSVGNVPTSSGLLNRDCSVLPVYLFTTDHKAETIDRIVAAVNSYQENNPSDSVTFRMADGNVGVTAATNEEVVASQTPILLYVFAVVLLPAPACWLLPRRQSAESRGRREEKRERKVNEKSSAGRFEAA
jgi:hypothetical protein